MYPYQNPTLSVEERVKDLLGRMTLREKIGQLTQRLYGFTSFTREGDNIRFSEEFEKEVEYYSGLGTLYGLHRADPWSAKTFETGLDGVLSTKATNQVQKYVNYRENRVIKYLIRLLVIMVKLLLHVAKIAQ